MYVITSAMSGIWNKQLVDDGAVSPTVLTLLHLLVSLFSDAAIMRWGRSRSGSAARPMSPGGTHPGVSGGLGGGRHSAYEIAAAFTPISVFVILAKLTTYFSYQYVSIALAHTAKASEPIFNVLVAGTIFSEFYPRPVYASLIPIAAGVALASVTDFSYNHAGFFWATLSACMKVLQNIFTKRLMNTGRFSFWEIHLYCGAASLLILSPVLLVQIATSGTSPFSHFPAVQLFVCSLLQYASSVSSYMVLNQVSHLTFTIINVMKRLFIILSGMHFYHQAFTPLNTVGVVCALSGVLAYQVVKDLKEWTPLPKDWTAASMLTWYHTLEWRYAARDTEGEVTSYSDYFVAAGGSPPPAPSAGAPPQGAGGWVLDGGFKPAPGGDAGWSALGLSDLLAGHSSRVSEDARAQMTKRRSPGSLPLPVDAAPGDESGGS